MGLSQFFSILRARRGLAGFILLSTLLIALGWVLLRPATYKAVAPVLVDTQRPDPMVNANYAYMQGMNAPSYKTTQIDIIKSDRDDEKEVKLLPPNESPMKALRDKTEGKPGADRVIANALQQNLEV